MPYATTMTENALRGMGTFLAAGGQVGWPPQPQRVVELSAFEVIEDTRSPVPVEQLEAIIASAANQTGEQVAQSRRVVQESINSTKAHTERWHRQRPVAHAALASQVIPPDDVVTLQESIIRFHAKLSGRFVKLYIEACRIASRNDFLGRRLERAIQEYIYEIEWHFVVLEKLILYREYRLGNLATRDTISAALNRTPDMTQKNDPRIELAPKTLAETAHLGASWLKQNGSVLRAFAGKHVAIDPRPNRGVVGSGETPTEARQAARLSDIEEGSYFLHYVSRRT